ncbi:MAG: hypothetical protein AB7I48_24575 [Planctomycetaceae bacterium]
MTVRAACLAVVITSLGCSTLPVGSLLKRSKFVEAGPKNPVLDVICIWEPAEGQGLDGLPSRGFAGQFLFLTHGSNEPAKVHGQVRVYVFDDQGTADEQGKPIHQFDFEAPAFAKYFYETSFGAAYQLFIPYTRKGTHEANCGLRVRFTPADGGPPVYSKLADITLPGAKPKTSAQRWQPEHRQLRADAAEQTGGPAPAGQSDLPTRSAAASPQGLTHAAASIPLRSNTRATRAASRLERLASRIAESGEAETIEQAVYETDEPASRRYRLHRDDEP